MVNFSMRKEFNIAEEVESATERIAPHARRTYLQPSRFYSEKTGANVSFKCENFQHTGSFKVRGALNKILSLTDEDIARGVVTASTGNHGAAVAFALGIRGASGTVFVPTGASESKLANMKRLGARIEVFGEDSNESERKARVVAEESGVVYVSPYNDPLVVAGQGTVGKEILEQEPEIDAVFVSVGGGGLISGIGGYLKARKPDITVVGCSPENSNVMEESVRSGRVLELPSLPTLSDGTAGGVDLDSITFEMCRDQVDEWISVGEEEIRSSLREFIGAEHMLIEGSAAVAVASVSKVSERFAGKNVAVVLCGANIGTSVLKNVLVAD